MVLTTLFNLFCPLMMWSSVKYSVFYMVLMTIIMSSFILDFSKISLTSKSLSGISELLFPLTGVSSIYFISVFMILAILDLISLTAFSYPVTTTLSFNLSAAMILWFISILILTNKSNPFSSFLPANSPWYLIPFLSMVELVSITVRPITLCFRLLANMSAGHILLALICKMNGGAWTLGALFGLLELMVSLVQSFVFLMLVMVYLEESMSH